MQLKIQARGLRSELSPRALEKWNPAIQAAVESTSDTITIYGVIGEDWYGDGVTVIEWADRARDLIPRRRLWITLGYTDQMKRSLALSLSCEGAPDWELSYEQFKPKLNCAGLFPAG